LWNYEALENCEDDGCLVRARDGGEVGLGFLLFNVVLLLLLVVLLLLLLLLLLAVLLLLVITEGSFVCDDTLLNTDCFFICPCYGSSTIVLACFDNLTLFPPVLSVILSLLFTLFPLTLLPLTLSVLASLLFTSTTFPFPKFFSYSFSISDCSLDYVLGL
jgi:hypothetical protein